MIEFGSILPDQKLCANDARVGEPYSIESAMTLAFEVAKGGLGYVSPNPLVGCVILDSEMNLVSTGFHKQYGEAHAEQAALEGLSSEKLEGATVVVTLEPCSFHGNTPSCAKLLAGLPIKKVVFASLDPNPKVKGSGIEFLKSAGIECEQLKDFQDLANQQNFSFFTRQIKSKNVAVAVKAAMTLDGKIAKAGDKRVWISSERALKYAHFLRLEYDALCIGASTLIQDNAQLTPRKTSYGNRAPWRVVFDPKLRGATTLGVAEIKMLKDQPERVMWVVAEGFKADESLENIKAVGANVLALPVDSFGRIDLDAFLKALPSFSIYSLLLEGGASLYRDFIDQGLVDRVHAVVAPKLLYGDNAISLYQGSSTLLEDATVKVFKTENELIFDIKPDFKLY